MRIIFAGSGEFGVPTLRALMDGGHEIVLVVTQPDRPAGRGRHVVPTPIAQFTIERNRPLLRTANINSETLPDADLLVVIAFGQKIAQDHVNHARLGAINLHGSLLPKFRGAAPINAAILAGETVSGNSVIRLAQTMDAGAILGQSTIPIGELETAGELHDRLAQEGPALMLEVIRKLDGGNAVETAQSDTLASRAPNFRDSLRSSTGNNPRCRSPGRFAAYIRGRDVMCRSLTRLALREHAQPWSAPDPSMKQARPARSCPAAPSLRAWELCKSWKSSPKASDLCRSMLTKMAISGQQE